MELISDSRLGITVSMVPWTTLLNASYIEQSKMLHAQVHINDLKSKNNDRVLHPIVKGREGAALCHSNNYHATTSKDLVIWKLKLASRPSPLLIPYVCRSCSLTILRTRCSNSEFTNAAQNQTNESWISWWSMEWICWVWIVRCEMIHAMLCSWEYPYMRKYALHNAYPFYLFHWGKSRCLLCVWTPVQWVKTQCAFRQKTLVQHVGRNECTGYSWMLPMSEQRPEYPLGDWCQPHGQSCLEALRLACPNHHPATEGFAHHGQPTLQRLPAHRWQRRELCSFQI